MQNYEINEFAAQSSLTQVASYFDIVDNSVKTGDTNKRYTISTNACNAPACPIKAGGWTSFVISPQGDNMCDLYNSFISVKMNINIKHTNGVKFEAHASTRDSIGPRYWVGFKDAMDAVSQYQLLANGQAFYTQSNAIEESYITNLATPEAVKKSDMFSKVRHEDVWKNKMGEASTRMGMVINPTTGLDSYPVDIDLKIDIRRFLPLSTIKMLPKFVGNFEIRIKFGYEGLVCTPLSPKVMLGSAANLASVSDVSRLSTQTNKFIPVGEPMKIINKITFAQANSVTTATINTPIDLTLSVTDAAVIEAHSHLACFGLDDNLYQGLISRYMKESLSFPVPTLTFQGMNGVPGNTSCDLTLAATPRFVDTIYILLQKNQNHRTCYENPMFTDFTLKMGSFGVIPDVQYDTSSPAFYEMVSNAFNANNDLAGFNDDVMKSLVNYTNSSTGYKSNDVSNFVLAFPVSTDFTYQQGQTSNTPVTYQLRANMAASSPYCNDTSCIPMMGFLKDSVLAIQLRPVGPPIVALDDYDITSPAG